MKTSIHVTRKSNETVRKSVSEALERVQIPWRNFLPDITFSSVPFHRLPKRTQRVWGIGAANPQGAARTNWSIRIIRPLRINGPRRIQIFLLTGNDAEWDYMFQRDILSAVFTTALENSVLKNAVRDVARQCKICHRLRPESLLTRELPSFLMNQEVLRDTQPDLFIFFERLGTILSELSALEEAAPAEV